MKCAINVFKRLSCIRTYGQIILGLTVWALLAWLSFLCFVRSNSTQLELIFWDAQTGLQVSWSNLLFICGVTDSWLNRQTERQIASILYVSMYASLSLCILVECQCVYTAKEISIKYFFSGNSAATVPIPTFMGLWAIYIFPGSVHIFPCSRIGRPILEIYKSLTDIWV